MSKLVVRETIEDYLQRLLSSGYELKVDNKMKYMQLSIHDLDAKEIRASQDTINNLKENSIVPSMTWVNE